MNDAVRIKATLKLGQFSTVTVKATFKQFKTSKLNFFGRFTRSSQHIIFASRLLIFSDISFNLMLFTSISKLISNYYARLVKCFCIIILYSCELKYRYLKYNQNDDRTPTAYRCIVWMLFFPLGFSSTLNKVILLLIWWLDYTLR